MDAEVHRFLKKGDQTKKLVLLAGAQPMTLCYLQQFS